MIRIILSYFHMLILGSPEHPGVLQHQVLPAEDPGRAPEAVLLPHHEALEEDNHHQVRGATAHRPPQILSSPSKGRERDYCLFVGLVDIGLTI